MFPRRIYWIFSIVFITSCSDSNEKNSRCAPASISPGLYDDGTVYFRSDKNFNVFVVSSGNNGDIDSLKYDEQNRLSTVRHISGGFGDLSLTTINWGADGRISSTSATVVNSDGFVVQQKDQFVFDIQGRLTQRIRSKDGDLFSTTSYEYIGENVSKMYYESTQEDRVLALELLTFDSHKRFFAEDEALMIYFVFIVGVEPSQNNVTSALVKKPYLLLTYDEPKELKLMLTYDNDGMPTSHSIVSGSETRDERFFSFITNSCE